MKRSLAITTLILVAVTSIMAQGVPSTSRGKAPEVASSAPLPTVDQVLDKYVQTIGGKAAINKVTSRRAAGSVEVPAMNTNGAVEIYTKAPNKSLTIINLPSAGAVQNGFNGTIGWEQNPRTGVRETTGANLAALKLDAEFYGNIKLRELYPGMALKNKTKVGDRDVYVIEATPIAGGSKKLYFDTQSGLLIRVDAERESPQGKFTTETYLDDYRDVDGIKIPFTLRQIFPGFSLTFKFNEIKNNIPIDDSRFNKPAGQ